MTDAGEAEEKNVERNVSALQTAMHICIRVHPPNHVAAYIPVCQDPQMIRHVILQPSPEDRCHRLVMHFSASSMDVVAKRQPCGREDLYR